MFAIDLKIHNFRSFAEASLSLEKYGLLVGRNNCGKSNVLDAIRVFYNDLKYEPGRDFPKFPTDDKDAWIEIEFMPTPDEFITLKDEYKLPEGTFRVRKYLKSDELDSSGKKKSGIYAYVGGNLSDSRFYGAKPVQQGKFGKVIHIPAVSKLDENTKLTGPSPLRDLLYLVLNSILEESKAYLKLTEAFKTFEGTLKTETTTNGISLESIEQEISNELTEWETEFEISINPLDLQTLVKYLVEHQFKDSTLDEDMPPESYGQGFQRNLIFSLIRIAAKYSSPVKTRDRKVFSPSLVLLLYEEPEAFLHPSQIDSHNTSLRKLAMDESAQVMITTHNPQFVSRNIDDLPALIRLRKEGGLSKVGQVKAPQLKSLFHENQEEIKKWEVAGVNVEEEDLTLQMEAAKYALWLNPLRCSSFFANQVLLVEGATERALIDTMLSNNEIPDAPQGTFVLDTLGKYNIHRFMNLFHRLGIPHAVLFDLDEGSHPEIAKTISDSRNEMTLGIKGFKGEIEDFLGVDKTDHWRKPQHVLCQYREGRINTERISSLVDIVSNILTN